MRMLQASVTRYGVAVALLVSAACGSSSSNSSGGDSGAAQSDGSTAQSDAGKTGHDAAAAALDCATYCAVVDQNCTGANAQYSAPGSCSGICKTFPTGTATDTSGDTLGCRIYHAGAAAQDPATHCSHAGLTGGDLNTTDDQPGHCGEGCEAFCNAAVATCSAVWATKDACMTDCKTFPASTSAFSTADSSGNTFNCRAYHLTAAAESATAATTHCPHIKKDSTVCQ